MAYTYPVKYIHSGMRGAPVLSGTAGAQATLLDTFLINGWGATTALSVTVSAGVGTATLTAGETFEPGAVVLVAGATPSLLNGEARVLTRSLTSITFETNAPDGLASGTIVIKYAPVGSWAHAFPPSGHKRVYRSSDVTGARFFYRLDDAGTTTSRLRGFESMTDIDTGTGPFPMDSQIGGGGYIGKSFSANATAAGYTAAADGRFVLLAPQLGLPLGAVYSGSHVRGFGDLLPLAAAGDAWAACVSVGSTDAYGDGTYSGSGGFDREYYAPFTQHGIYLCRGHSGLGGSVRSSGNRGQTGSNSTNPPILSGADGTLGACPSPVTGSVFVAQRFVLAHDAPAPRALIPGIRSIPQSAAISSLQHLTRLPGEVGMSARTLLSVLVADSATIQPQGVALFDVTGPWR